MAGRSWGPGVRKENRGVREDKRYRHLRRFLWPRDGVGRVHIFPPQVGSARGAGAPSVSRGRGFCPRAFFKEVPRPRVILGTKARPDTGLLSQCRRHSAEHRGQSRATGDCGRGSPQKFVAQLCFRETCWGRAPTRPPPGCGG